MQNKQKSVKVNGWLAQVFGLLMAILNAFEGF
jgi:hypothetical protein